MKPALQVILCLAAAAVVGAVESAVKAPFVILNATAWTPPLDAVDMRRMAAGQPPLTYASINLGFSERDSGQFSYSCGSCDKWHAPWPRIDCRFMIGSPFTVKDLLVSEDLSGAIVVLDEHGVTKSIASREKIAFLRQEKNVIISDLYWIYDCEHGPDGEMQPVKGAPPIVIRRIKELPTPDPTALARFEVAYIFPGSGELDMVTLIECEANENRTQSTISTYQDNKVDETKLLERDILQRVTGDEAGTYKQIRRKEVPMKDGSIKTEQHVIEVWQVDKAGVRSRLSIEDLLKVPDDEPAGETI